MSVYIYGLRCPLMNEIRYIGKSTNPTKRAKAHVRSAIRGDYHHHTSRWLRKLIGEGLEPTLEIIRQVRPDERWQDVERAEISAAIERGCRLTNSTAGGEGLDYIDPEAGAIYRAKLSATMKGLWNRPERREEARQRSLDAWGDEEITKRRIASLKAFYDVPENKDRAGEISRAIGARPEVKAKRSSSVRKSWEGDDGDNRRRNIASGDHNKRLVESALAKWADPIKRDQLHQALRRPEVRAKQSQRAKDRATPEYRAMMAEKTRLSWEKRRLLKGQSR